MAMPGSKHLEAIVDYIIARICNVAKEKSVSLIELGYHITVLEVCPTSSNKSAAFLKIWQEQTLHRVLTYFL